MNATATVLPASTAIAPPTATIPSASSSVAPAPPQHMRAPGAPRWPVPARAELKRKVAMDLLDVAAVVLNCPWEAESMAVADLLMSQRRWGQTRCRKFLAQVPMSERKTIGSMTDRQRRTLASMLSSAERDRDRAWGAAPLLTGNLTTA